MRFHLLYWCLLWPLLAFSQPKDTPFLESIQLDKRTIVDPTGAPLEYVISTQPTNPAGLIVYCTGSLPVPLFIRSGADHFSTIPFSFRRQFPDHRVAVMSKPGLHTVIPKAALNDQNQLVDSSGFFPQAYTQRNYLDYYVTTTNTLIDELTASADYPAVIIMGHSQGARVAAKVAATNSKVTHLVYLSGNPLGRYDQLIREKREANLLGMLTDEEAQEQIEALYARWREINSTPNDLSTQGGDSHKTWSSFSEGTVDELLSLEVPIFIGYGTRDIVARYCDLLPIHFTAAGKNNLTLKAYPGYDHSFYRKYPDGRIDFEDYLFPKVMKDVNKWISGAG